MDWFLISILGFVLLLIVIPKLPPISFRREPIAEIFNSGSKELEGLLMKVEPEHKFPDGTVREGWLVRGANGMELWIPADRMQKAKRVYR